MFRFLGIVQAVLLGCGFFGNARGATVETAAPGGTLPTTVLRGGNEGDEKGTATVSLTGKLDMREPGADAQSAEDFDGALTSKTDSTLIKAKDEDVLQQLKSKDGKTLTLEGKLKEKDGKKFLLVSQIAVRAQPPSGFRNPRGL